MFVSLPTSGNSQTSADTVRTLDSVRVLAVPRRAEIIALNPITPEHNKLTLSLNLTDFLARIPGISQLTTGAAIAKPVLRGLYGNRVLVLLNGLRFDAQQWQDEHGLGLSQLGVESIAVNRTGASALYGTEAVGGSIQVYEEAADSGEHRVDATVRLRSSTLGTLTDAGYTNGTGHLRYHLRAGIESGADYLEGGGTRVLNSRYAGYYFRAGAGWKRGRWEQYNRYALSYNQYGFILEELVSFFSPDARTSRAMSGPHHNVLLNVVSSNNVVRFRKSVLELNVGGQSNRRAEDEGGGAISLDVHLLSAAQNAAWTVPLGRKWTVVARQAFLFQDNTNLGKRVLIPDAHTTEAHGGLEIRGTVAKRFEVSFAGGATSRSIRTAPTGALNAAGTEVQPFAIRRAAGNATASFEYRAAPVLSFLLTAATGARAPNLAELSSQGVHEGTFRYEIGSAALRAEKSRMIELGMAGATPERGQTVAVSYTARAFYNDLRDYIFLAPTGEKKYGFDVHRYFQTDAVLWGGEAGTVVGVGALSPQRISVQWKETFAYVLGRQTGGAPLPNIPPPQLRSSIYAYFKANRWMQSLYISPEVENNFSQVRTALYELPSKGYSLLNLTTGASFIRSKRVFDVTLAARNLLDKRYASHLSRLRYYGIADPGVNIILSLHISLGR